jgi:hypothetical protein
MVDQHTPSFRQIEVDRDWWLNDSGTHYRELAAWLRELASKCRLPNPRRELLDLARRYEHMSTGAFTCNGRLNG